MQELIAFFAIFIVPFLNFSWEVYSIGFKIFRFFKNLSNLEKQETYLTPEDLATPENPSGKNQIDPELEKYFKTLEQQ